MICYTPPFAFAFTTPRTFPDPRRLHTFARSYYRSPRLFPIYVSIRFTHTTTYTHTLLLTHLRLPTYTLPAFTHVVHHSFLLTLRLHVLYVGLYVRLITLHLVTLLLFRLRSLPAAPLSTHCVDVLSRCVVVTPLRLDAVPHTFCPAVGYTLHTAHVVHGYVFVVPHHLPRLPLPVRATLDLWGPGDTILPLLHVYRYALVLTLLFDSIFRFTRYVPDPLLAVIVHDTGPPRFTAHTSLHTPRVVHILSIPDDYTTDRTTFPTTTRTPLNIRFPLPFYGHTAPLRTHVLRTPACVLTPFVVPRGDSVVHVSGCTVYHTGYVYLCSRFVPFYGVPGYVYGSTRSPLQIHRSGRFTLPVTPHYTHTRHYTPTVFTLPLRCALGVRPRYLLLIPLYILR